MGSGFPRFRVLRGVYQLAEQATGKLPLQILTPTIGAFIGTAWAVSHPSEIIRHGLVVTEPSFVQVLLLALAGTVVAVAAVTTVLFWAIFTYERVIVPHFDCGTWKPLCATFDSPKLTPSQVAFQLACCAEPPISVASLGDMECWIRRPDGQMDAVRGDDISQTMSIPLGDRQVPAAHVWYDLRGVSGRYRVRWYGSTNQRRPKRYEIARATHNIEVPPPDRLLGPRG